LTSGLTYYYYVTAVANYVDYTSNYESLPSNEVSAATTLLSSPSAPLNLTATMDATTVAVDLSWLPPANNGNSSILGYFVYRGSAPGTEVELANIAQASYQDSNVSVGEMYYYEVYAYSEVGTSPASQEISITTTGVQYFSIAGFDPFLIVGALAAGVVFLLEKVRAKIPPI
jgi:fibronectin type 3 domain-containing protein